MQITRDDEFRRQIIDKIAQREFYERTGTHSSDLIYCLNKQALRRLKPLPQEDQETLIYSLGWASQRWLTGSFEPDKEYEVDGIVVTPDALDGCPWELKCTYASSIKAIEEMIHWIRQIMAQCYVTGRTIAYLSRLEIMGNWKWVYRPSKPETVAKLVEEFGENWAEHPTLSAWRLEFTQEELDRNWEWMKERRDKFEEILRTGKLLPPAVALASGMEWECDYCRYKEECEVKS